VESVGRNQPCPCGSGRRYKECHGAIDAAGAQHAAAPSVASAPSWVPQTMAAALAAQKRGQSREAVALYRRVLAVDPSNFDATNMLGLVEYELGHHDAALALIKHAIELRPELGMPRHNLRLLESLPLLEAEICREVLPRIVSRVNLGLDLAELASAASVDIVAGDRWEAQERAALTQIVAACRSATVMVWGEASDAAVPGMSMTRLSAADSPRGAFLIVLGTGRSLASWLHTLRAEHVLLVATREAPCTIIDRIDELAVAGCSQPALLCATPELAARLRLPRTASLRQIEPESVEP
jgi:tetratricopeptide repeat protein/SEC-C motif-containing protein